MIGGSDAKVLVTGRRTNIFDYNMRFITKDVHENDINIERAAQSGVLFREDALVGFCAIAQFPGLFHFHEDDVLLGPNSESGDRKAAVR